MPKCNSFCIGKPCKRKKRCACTCGALLAQSPALEEACVKACNGSNPPKSPEDFKCSQIGGEILYAQYGVVDCGYDIRKSAQYQSEDINREIQEEQQADGKQMQKVGLAVLAVLVLATVGAFVFGK